MMDKRRVPLNTVYSICPAVQVPSMHTGLQAQNYNIGKVKIKRGETKYTFVWQCRAKTNIPQTGPVDCREVLLS